MSDAEFAAQRDGFARALQTPQVRAAIAEAGRVEVAVLFWADADFPVSVIPWHGVSDSAERARLVASIGAHVRRVTGTTGLANGLRQAVDLIAARRDCDLRRVVNVSGDGRDTRSPRPRNASRLPEERLRAERLGITVNALALGDAEPDLAEYFRTELITGPDAFVVEAAETAHLTEVITQKLVREIRPMQVAAGP